MPTEDSMFDTVPTAIPTPRQLEFQSWELGLFLHFGIRTFYEGHRDFDGQPMSPEAFNPTELDCDGWARTAAEAGFKYLVFTAKHHDGFCNWPSQYTDFCTASSPWQNGQGDVVKELAAACAGHGIKFGVYYSPADWKSPVYDDPKAYDDYFVNQLSELLTNYGPIDILWFDGCGSENHTYDWARIIRETRRMQPNVLLFNMGDPDFRWVGNEYGIAPIPLWNTATEITGSILSTEADLLTAPQWLPAECDCRMREGNWFYSDQDEHTVKSLDELMGLFYLSVGRGANLLINIGPDRRGKLPDLDAARLLEFGAEIRRRFSNPLATLEDFTQESGTQHTFATPTLIDHVIIQEDLTNGEHITSFEIQIKPLHGPFYTVWRGENIGHKAICRFPAVKAKAVRVVIVEAEGEAQLDSVAVFYVGA